ncbi:hypothetical protein Bb109J_c1927 [Bdellovibrio bacteriovorus]|uniref:hypothetical protein n=1 Tax=Bdellovibrio bacteriovorus TaxID=959 RepID=UPI00045C03D1|nr:hypothetical protein [Bdellovibrio bacteriovorus]AHZ84618.1 hypothetical protein EP01_06660 [Bdellovibrio bacteriovorus]BEV68507.1 hypothetical protein Bb109J_c1927 [Bdellovibrio bacteriovorus]
MNAKNLLKVLGISFVISAVGLLGFLFWGLSKLPSASDLKKALTPPALQKTAHASSNEPGKSTVAGNSDNSADVAEAAAALPAATPALNAREKLAQDTVDVLLKDFADPRKPLVDGCRNLEKAAQSGLLRDPQNASAKYFFSSLSDGNHDPMVETAAPILRFIFRAPGMEQVVEQIMNADAQNDQGLLKKAEFYYEIYRAGDYLQKHTADMDQILQKSYNMHYLARAVAAKPELARDSATLDFCDQMEKNINAGGEFNADEAASEMSKFLNSAGLDAKAIGYDPAYRSKVKVQFNSTRVGVNDSWVVSLFARDIERAQKAPSGK